MNISMTNIFPPVKKLLKLDFLNCDPTFSSDWGYGRSDINFLTIFSELRAVICYILFINLLLIPCQVPIMTWFTLSFAHWSHEVAMTKHRLWNQRHRGLKPVSVAQYLWNSGQVTSFTLGIKDSRPISSTSCRYLVCGWHLLSYISASSKTFNQTFRKLNMLFFTLFFYIKKGKALVWCLIGKPSIYQNINTDSILDSFFFFNCYVLTPLNVVKYYLKGLMKITVEINITRQIKCKCSFANNKDPK